MRIPINDLLIYVSIILPIIFVVGGLRDASLHIYNHFLIRALRSSKFKSIGLAIIDITFTLIISICLILSLFYYNGGVFRFIFPLVMILGYIIYKVIMSKIILRIITLTCAPLERLIINTIETSKKHIKNIK